MNLSSGTLHVENQITLTYFSVLNFYINYIAEYLYNGYGPKRTIFRYQIRFFAKKCFYKTEISMRRTATFESVLFDLEFYCISRKEISLNALHREK